MRLQTGGSGQLKVVSIRTKQTYPNRLTSVKLGKADVVTLNRMSKEQLLSWFADMALAFGITQPYEGEPEPQASKLPTNNPFYS